MNGGRHRRPEADPLPEVDLAERLKTGPAGPVVHDVASAPVGAAPAAPGPTVVARRSRAAERAARRRRQQRRVILGAGALVGVGLVAVTGWLLLAGPDAAEPGPTAAPRAEQLVTLVQLIGTDGTAAASAIVGTTAAEDSAVAVLVPSRLQVDVAGSGDLPFGETTTLGDDDAPAAALTDLLGVRIEDHWTLTKPALAALVDAVGGVQAAVDVDVLDTAPDGDQTVVVRAGSQVLDGPSAADYATYLAEAEPEQARLARFDDVLSALAAELPDDATGIGAFVASAGDGASSNLDDGALAQRLAVLRTAAAGGDLVSDVLPVNEIDTGGTLPSYGLNSGDAAAALKAKFPGALQEGPAGGVVRVLVENGVGTPGLVELARDALVEAGFRFKNGGNASSFDDSLSSIQVPDGTSAAIERGERVAAALGLPADAVTPTDRGQNVADVIVILGSDFVPAGSGPTS